MPDTRLDPHEVSAALSARQQLGHEFDAAVAESFVERVSQTIDARVDARLQLQEDRRPQRAIGFWSANGPLMLAVTSIGCSVPITAIAGHYTGLSGIVVAWAGIAAVNIAFNWRRR